MTDDADRDPVPPDVVALAGLDAAEAARVRADAATGPGAASVLDALAATRAELGALPVPDVPPAVEERWTAALAAERLRTPHPRGGPPGRGPRRRRPSRRVLAAAALVLLAGIGLGLLARRPDPPPDVTRVQLVALGREAVGTLDVGALAERGRRDACLGVVAPAAAGEALLGGRRVVLDGRPGVLLVLATGARGGLRILTVDPGCGPGGGTLLAQVVVG
jgi:hypothetical protein